MDCILSRCAHRREAPCAALGECGAAFALAKAKQPEGYSVHIRDNPTINALVAAGLIYLVNPTATALAVRKKV